MMDRFDGASFGDGFCKIRKNNGTPQPANNLNGKAYITTAIHDIEHQKNRRQCCNDLNRKHNGTFDKRTWI